MKASQPTKAKKGKAPAKALSLAERLQGVPDDGTPPFPKADHQVASIFHKLPNYGSNQRMEIPSCLLPPLF